MATIDTLNKLLQLNKISQQAYRTYKGQIKHGDESACIIGLQRKHLIDDKGEVINGEVNTSGTGRKNT